MTASFTKISLMRLINIVFRKPIILILLLGITMSAKSQHGNSKYNKTLADSLGADEYGMKSYVLVILKSGPNKATNQAQKDSLFAGHLKNIRRLASLGKLTVAGPLENNDKDYRGIFILNVQSTAEATALLQTDPAIKAGLLEPELYGWYGSAALPMYLPFVEKVEKKSF